MATSNHTFLLCFDFDGTLAEPSHEPPFHPRMLDYIKVLRKAGAGWVINSGRGLSNLINGFGQYGVFMLPDYIVANEYEIYQPNSFNRWEDYGSWNKQVNKDQRRFHRTHKKALRELQKWVQSDVRADMLEDESGGWGIVAETRDEMERICQRIGEIQSTMPDMGFQRNGRHLRFSHSGYNKGMALAELARSLSIEPYRIFTAGDNHNDLPMLQPDIAKFRACPTNSEDEVKELLRSTGGYVASMEASLGMMQALRYFFRENLNEAGITVNGRDLVLEED